MTTLVKHISAADLNLDPEDLEAELEEREFQEAYTQFRWKKKHVGKVKQNTTHEHTKKQTQQPRET